MSLLDSIREPADLRRLSRAELDGLAREIRDFLVDRGVQHRRPPRPQPRRGRAHPRAAPGLRLAAGPDRLGHRPPGVRAQDRHRPGRRVRPAAAGRRAVRLPVAGPSPSTTWIENSHASTALSYADGLAKAYQLRGERTARVVAVVGDGALTGGMCWEALNNIAAAKDRPVVIVVNDNGRSYAPTIGGLADHLATLRTSRATSGSSSGASRPLKAHPGRRRPALRRAARGEEGAQGLHRPAGHVRGPRPEVRRAGRRARRRGGRSRR